MSSLRALFVLAVLVVASLPVTATDPPTPAGVDPALFEVTVLAEDLFHPTSMVELDDGSLVVLTNQPLASLFDSTAALLHLVDADDDGVADAPGVELHGGLPGVATSLRRWGDLYFVSNQQVDNAHITVLRASASLAFTELGSIDFDYPWGGHYNVGLAVRPTPGVAGSVEVFFNVGSALNFAATTTPFSAGGLLAGVPGASAMSADSIYRVTLSDDGTVVTVIGLDQIATGLRNASGLAFHPVTGDLYFAENGIDGITGDVNEPLSADELNVIAEADLGGAIEDFGFPDNYTEYRSGLIIGGAGVQPTIAYQPIPDPLTGAESEGPVEIAFSPPLFPAVLQGGVFTGFHGRFSQAGLGNEENPLVFADLGAGTYFHFFENTELCIGHPNGLLAAGDSLYVADLSSSGSVFTTFPTGVIYRVRATGGGAVEIFVRGDCNDDGAVNIADVVRLGGLFTGGAPFACDDACDGNDDGTTDIADMVAILTHLFSSGPDLPAPFAGCGSDPTADGLDCAGFVHCP